MNIILPTHPYSFIAFTRKWWSKYLSRNNTYQFGLVPAQDVHFFYTRSHLSALQDCALIFQAIFSLFSHLKNALHNLVFELCSALKISQKYWRLLIKFTHSFVAIELLTVCNNAKNIFYCSREFSVFRT